MCSKSHSRLIKFKVDLGLSIWRKKELDIPGPGLQPHGALSARLHLLSVFSPAQGSCSPFLSGCRLLLLASRQPSSTHLPLQPTLMCSFRPAMISHLTRPPLISPRGLLLFFLFLTTLLHMDFPGQGSDPRYSFDPSCSCGKARSLTHCARPGIKPTSQDIVDPVGP